MRSPCRLQTVVCIAKSTERKGNGLQLEIPCWQAQRDLSPGPRKCRRTLSFTFELHGRSGALPPETSGSSQYDLTKIFQHYEVDQSRLEAALTKAIDGFKTGNARPPALSPLLVELIRDAWLFASVEFGEPIVRSGHLLLAAITNSKISQMILTSARELGKLSADSLAHNLRDITNGTVEDVPTARSSAPGGAPEMRPGGGKTPALDQYTVDLTAAARGGNLDNVSGRDFEIRQLVDILMRRRQNNPILTGEAGVGKTAVVEGFAQRIAAGDVPPPLQNVAVRVLDLGLLQAGAGVKGDFENRLKSVIPEVKRHHSRSFCSLTRPTH